MNWKAKGLPCLIIRAANDKALLADLIFNNPDLIKKNIADVWIIKALEIINMRELRGMLSKQNQRDWNRLMGDTKK